MPLKSIATIGDKEVVLATKDGKPLFIKFTAE
jgi:hypothetical protein